jgi:hypothetical protein
MRRAILLVLALGFGTLIAREMPGIRRYIKISRM